jgi:hypothetical protein
MQRGSQEFLDQIAADVVEEWTTPPQLGRMSTKDLVENNLRWEEGRVKGGLSIMVNRDRFLTFEVKVETDSLGYTIVSYDMDKDGRPLERSQGG